MFVCKYESDEKIKKNSEKLLNINNKYLFSYLYTVTFTVKGFKNVSVHTYIYIYIYIYKYINYILLYIWTWSKMLDAILAFDKSQKPHFLKLFECKVK